LSIYYLLCLLWFIFNFLFPAIYSDLSEGVIYMKLVFIRHTTLSITRGICYGQTDVPVSSHFTDEAARVNAQLAPYTFDAVYSSPLTRCTQLAQSCGYPQPIPDARLLELHFGRWEMQAWTDIPDAEIEPWYADWLNYPTPDGESFAQQIARVHAFIDDLARTNHQTIAIFTHGGVIRSAAIYFKLVEPTDAFSFPVDYGSVTEFELTDFGGTHRNQ